MARYNSVSLPRLARHAREAGINVILPTVLLNVFTRRGT
jgi:hypothetical protein